MKSVFNRFSDKTGMLWEPVKSTLTSLSCYRCAHPDFKACKLRFLQQLPKLAEIGLIFSLSAPLDALTIQSLTPPSRLLSTLKNFYYDEL